MGKKTGKNQQRAAAKKKRRTDRLKKRSGVSCFWWTVRPTRKDPAHVYPHPQTTTAPLHRTVQSRRRGHGHRTRQNPRRCCCNLGEMVSGS